MPVLYQSALSLQYVQAQVEVTSEDPYDPTGDAVTFAFTRSPLTEPADDDWTPATWTTWPGPQYWAQLLIGPGGNLQLADGTWQAWLRITDSPEVPVLKPFTLVIEP